MTPLFESEWHEEVAQGQLAESKIACSLVGDTDALEFAFISPLDQGAPGLGKAIILSGETADHAARGTFVPPTYLQTLLLPAKRVMYEVQVEIVCCKVGNDAEYPIKPIVK